MDEDVVWDELDIRVLEVEVCELDWVIIFLL